MAAPETQPRDLHPDPAPERTHAPSQGEHSSGRWEREAAARHEAGPEDSATKSSRIYFFIILAIIIAGIALFLILHPQGGG